MKSITFSLASSDDIPLYTKLAARACAFMLASILVVSTFGTHAVAYAPEQHAGKNEKNSSMSTDDEEILWLARTLYSETKRPDEQLLVAWVIRNRVASVRYPNTYTQVVLQKGQFSGMHATDKQYEINRSREYTDTGKGWDSAVHIARTVYHTAETDRILEKDVYHFYSPHAVKKTPAWAAGEVPVKTIQDPGTTSARFAFYAGIR